MAKAQDSYTHRLGWKLLLPRTRPSSARRIASTGTRCPATTSGSTHGRGARVCRACARESQQRFRATARRQTSDRKTPSPVRGKPGLPRRRTDLERMLDRTVLGRSDPELGTCWVYTGPANPYGRIGKGPERSTHRLGWIWLHGPIPDGMELHHRCGVHACWNPEHLKIVTHAENMAITRNTVNPCCKRGHALSGENLRVGPNGQRICRACNAEKPASVSRPADESRVVKGPPNHQAGPKPACSCGPCCGPSGLRIRSTWGASLGTRTSPISPVMLTSAWTIPSLNRAPPL